MILCNNVVPLLLFFFISEKIHSIRTDMRIVGGYLAHIETFPYSVSLQVRGRHTCGGALISNKFVVTAAHCVELRNSYSIKAGTDNLAYSGIVVKVKKVIIHPEYSSITADHDVAILELETNVPYIRGKIRNVGLPKYSRTVPLQIGTVVGWGETYKYHERMNHMRAVDLEVYTHDVCEKLGAYHLTIAMFCAGHHTGRKDSCNGDSGGPFVIENVLYGIVSFGSEQCGNGLPGVYTKIPFVVNWIEKVIGLPI